MRRLSLRPMSSHGSPRSSIGPDSQFALFSHGSGAPILAPNGTLDPQVPRNKLVKRSTTATGNSNVGILARRGSRPQVPTLRRPATSHQRSATMHGQAPFSPISAQTEVSEPFGDRQSRPRASTTVQPNNMWSIEEPSGWTSFFHSRRVRTIHRGSIVRPNVEGNTSSAQLPGMRIQMRRGSIPRAFLVSPTMITGDLSTVMTEPPAVEQSPVVENSPASDNISPRDTSKVAELPEVTPTKKTRRSMSTQLNSSSGWIARAGSLRRPKRPLEAQIEEKRNISAPVTTAPSGDLTLTLDTNFDPPAQRRSTSSPIPPLSRLSSFHIDLSKMGASPPPSAGLQAPSPTQMNSGVTAHSMSTISHSRAVSYGRASTLAGSDQGNPGLASGDDDDTDYKSDVVFDSYRTDASNRLRNVETPLESMFDDSPPGTCTASNGKTKRLSIQEILGQSWDGDTRIMEEDEGSSTPIRGLHSSHINNVAAEDHALELAKFQLSLSNRDYRRLSLDTTDDDYDWARDDEDALSNHLSPPSSSVNSRRGASPELRSALANISGNGCPDANTLDTASERPRSNIFDWSESSMERADDGFSRPKTVHGKKELDLRGGRPMNRKGLVIGHIRSQSVPVVPDPCDSAKTAPKFGTWGLGTKTASEDWDDDFDFDEGSNTSVGGRNPAKTMSMYVPASIRDTQPTVKAHSTHIRELNHLVSNLKRLCRQGRDLNLLDGQSALLWKEAENIIALASPDDEDLEDNDANRSSSEFDPLNVDERFLEEGFDSAMLESAKDHVEAQEPNFPNTTVVRERHVVRRRSVFSPEDDIFGTNWPLDRDGTRPHTPKTPDRVREFHTPDGAVVSSVIEAMEQQRSKPNQPQESPLKPSKAKLNFDTNSLQELVRRASTVFHTLSDLVRKEELLTQSPAATPKQDRHNRRHDGSPAFTRVFTDPESSPQKRVANSQNSTSRLSRKSLDVTSPNGMGQRMQMMTVS